MGELMERVATELGLTIEGRFDGGEFGALRVRRGGEDMVLKVAGDAAWLPIARQGARIANRLRSANYPAPEYVGIGTFEGSTWTLQRMLPSRVPGVMTRAHVEALLALAERHSDFAEAPFDWQSAAFEQTGRSLGIVRGVAPDLAAELEGVLVRTAGIELRRGDVVHSDFHHRNFLAEGDRVTGVFDWEIASPGDWRFDAVTLAFWARVVPGAATDEARDIARRKAEAICDPATLAFMTVALAVRQVAFYARRKPERVPGLLAAIEASVASWWRDG